MIEFNTLYNLKCKDKQNNTKSYFAFSHLIIILILFINLNLFSQTENIGIGTITPDNSAVLHITFSNPANPKGLLIPKLTTTERNSITSPANGLIVYNTTTNAIEYNSGTPVSPVWVVLFSSGNLTLADGNIFVGNGSGQATAVVPSGDVTISNTGVATIQSGAVTTGKILDGTILVGDLADGAVTSTKILDGTIANADLADNSVNGAKISLTSEANGSMMYYNGTDWVNLAAGTNGFVLKVTAGIPTWTADNSLSTTLNNGQVFVGNGSNVATGVPMTGDVTISNAGATTISNNAVTTGKILDGTILAADIATGAVTTTQILDGTIASGDLADNSVTTIKITDANVTTAKIADNSVNGTKISLTSEANGSMMYYNGTDWVNLAVGLNNQQLKVTSGVPAWATDNSLSTTLTSGQIFVGNGSNVATGVPMTGDVTISNTGATTISNNAVTTGKILDGTITSADLADGAVTNGKLADASILEVKIGNNQVTVDKIAANSIIEAKIQDGAVTSVKILDGTIANADISATAEIDVTKLGNGTNDQLIRTNGTNVEWFTPTFATSSSAVGGDLSGTIANAQIIANAVGTSEIADGAVTSAKVFDGTIATADLADGSVNSTKITDLSIVAGDIANNTITATQIANGTITSTQIADGTIANADVSATAEIDVTKLGNGTNDQLIRTNGTNVEWFTPTFATSSSAVGGDLSGTIANAQIIANAVGTTEIADGAVTSAKVFDGTIATADLADGSVNSTKITDLSIVAGDIANNTITATQIANGTITTTQIADGTIANADVSATAEIDVTKLGNGTNDQLIRTNGTNVEWFTPTFATSSSAVGGDLSGTIANAQIIADAVTSSEIADGTIVVGDIADGAVTSGKILDGTILVGDLADGAVTTGKILDGTIANADVSATAEIDVTKLGNGTNDQLIRTNGTNVEWFTPTFATSSSAVGGDLSGTIANAQIIANAVTSSEIADGTIVVGDIADGAVTTGKILDGTIANSDISATAEIDVTKLGNGTNDQLIRTNGTNVEWFTPIFATSSSAVGGDLSGTIANAQIIADAVTSSEIADGTIVVGDIADGAVTTGKILDGTIANGDIADGTITGAKLVDGTLSNSKLTLTNGRMLIGTAGDVASEVVISGDAQINDTGVLTINTASIGSDEITNGTIMEIDITDAAITANKLASNSVTTIKIGDGQVTNDKLAGSIDPNKITVANANIIVGNTGVGSAVAMSGDAGITNTGALTVSAIQGIAVSTTDPTDNQVLAYNNTNSRWEPKTLGRSRVRAYRNTSVFSIPNNSVTRVVFNATNFEEPNATDFDETTGVFTAPVTGYYQVNSRIKLNFTALGAADRFAQVMLYKDGALYSYGNRLTLIDQNSNENFDNEGYVIADLVYLTSGQTLDVRFEQNSGFAINMEFGTAESYVSIHLLSE